MITKNYYAWIPDSSSKIERHSGRRTGIQFDRMSGEIGFLLKTNSPLCHASNVNAAAAASLPKRHNSRHPVVKMDSRSPPGMTLAWVAGMSCSQAFIKQVFPFGVHVFYQLYFPYSPPLLQFLFSSNRFLCVSHHFVVHEFV